MALDGITIYALAKELSLLLENCKIEKVNQPTKEEIVLTVRKHAFNHKLLINVSSNNPRVHFLKENRENPKTPPMFCMFLRKHLVGSVIRSVTTNDFERLITLEVETYDEMGFKTTKYIIIELLGKFSNLILINKDKMILDCLKRVDFESSVRPVLPNIYYDYPPKQEKMSILDINDGFFVQNKEELVEKIKGLSPILSDILYNTDFEIQKDNLQNFKQYVENGEFNTFILYKDGVPFDFSILPHTKFDSVLQDKFSFMLCDFYEIKEQTNALKSVHKELTKTIKTLINRKIKKIKVQEDELLQTKEREIFQRYGDVIISNMYAISDEKSENITLTDYYSDDLSEIVIPLDVKFTPKQNADKYFLKYNKLKNAEEILTVEIKKAKDDILYLESVLESTMRTETTNDVLEIKNELMDEGFINRPKTKNQPKIKQSMPNKYITSDGFTVYAGKNNTQNDVLTLKTARKSDIWFHTQKIHGTHVILFTEGKEVPETSILECAIIAAFNSKAKTSANVPVDYCPVSNVKKPRGAKAGMVIYDNYNTIYATPDIKLIEKLMVD